MSDEVLDNLLADIPTGAEIKDPREGEHLARIDIIEEVQFKSGNYGLLITYGDMTDTDGREFTHKARITYPRSDSEPFVQRIFLALAHDLGVLPRSNKNALFIENEESRSKALAAFKKAEGSTVRLRIRTDNNGYLRENIIRS